MVIILYMFIYLFIYTNPPKDLSASGLTHLLHNMHVGGSTIKITIYANVQFSYHAYPKLILNNRLFLSSCLH